MRKIRKRKLQKSEKEKQKIKKDFLKEQKQLVKKELKKLLTLKPERIRQLNIHQDSVTQPNKIFHESTSISGKTKLITLLLITKGEYAYKEGKN